MNDTRYTMQDKDNTPLNPPFVMGELRGGIVNHESCIVHQSSIMNRASCIVHRDNSGFTIIELVITMVLIGIVAFIVADAMSTGFKAYFTTDFRKEALDQARIATERMTREIRNVRSLGRDNDSDGNIDADIATATATSFCFTDVNGTTISFALSGTNILRGEGNCPPDSTNTLSENITSLSFSYIYASGTFATAIRRVQITLTSTISNESVTLQSEVYLRNLQ
jgi:prepilin-type N-terminal cleavage/methylation domain-containing protein